MEGRLSNNDPALLPSMTEGDGPVPGERDELSKPGKSVVGGDFGLEVAEGLVAGTESDASVWAGAETSSSSSESMRSAQLFLPRSGELGLGVGG